MTTRGSNFEAVARRGLMYAIAFALLFCAFNATRVFWTAARTARSHVVSTTVCYVALSNDLAPLFGTSVSAIAAAPECSAQHDHRGNPRDAARMTS
jgi:hypothetical protein